MDNLRKIIYFYILPILIAFSFSTFFLFDFDKESYLGEIIIWLLLIMYLLIRFILDRKVFGVVIMSILGIVSIFYTGLMVNNICDFNRSCYLEHSEENMPLPEKFFGLFSNK